MKIGGIIFISGIQVTQVLQALAITWDSNTGVVAATSPILMSPWMTATLLSCSYTCLGGTFTAQIQHNGTAVTGLSALPVSSSQGMTSASGNNVLANGDILTLVTSGVSGTPNTAIIQLNLQTSTS